MECTRDAQDIETVGYDTQQQYTQYGAYNAASSTFERGAAHGHSGYRLQLIPGSEALVARQGLPSHLDEALLGVVLSGSGSCLAGLVTDQGEAVAQWMVQQLSAAGTRARALVLDVSTEGVTVRPNG